jgi:hypothetical protein
MESVNPIETALNLLRADLIWVRDALLEVSGDLVREGYSKYPVFIARETEPEWGELLFDRAELNLNYYIAVSYLEELTEQGIVAEDKQALFIANFKDPSKHFCFLLISGKAGAHLVFVPTAAQAPADSDSKA